MKHIIILFLMILFACSTNKEQSSPVEQEIEKTLDVVEKNERETRSSLVSNVPKSKILNTLVPDTLNISDSLYYIYQYYDSIHDYRVGDFTSNLLHTIDQFRNKAADTTILLIGDIDGKHDANDTISSRIVVSNSVVHINSLWIRKGKHCWKHHYINPYIHVTSNEVFDIYERSVWVTFSTAIYHGVPEFEEHFDDGSPNNPVQQLNGQETILYGDPSDRLTPFVWDESNQEFRKW